jgi:hypothetical protein
MCRVGGGSQDGCGYMRDAFHSVRISTIWEWFPSVGLTFLGQKDICFLIFLFHAGYKSLFLFADCLHYGSQRDEEASYLFQCLAALQRKGLLLTAGKHSRPSIVYCIPFDFLKIRLFTIFAVE